MHDPQGERTSPGIQTVPAAALEDALEGLAVMYGFLDEHWRTKFPLYEYIQRAGAVLSGEPDPTVDAVRERLAEGARFWDKFHDKLHPDSSAE